MTWVFLRSSSAAKSKSWWLIICFFGFGRFVTSLQQSVCTLLYFYVMSIKCYLGSWANILVCICPLSSFLTGLQMPLLFLNYFKCPENVWFNKYQIQFNGWMVIHSSIYWSIKGCSFLFHKADSSPKVDVVRRQWWGVSMKA